MDRKLAEYEQAHPEWATCFPVFGELGFTWNNVVKATKVFNGGGAETGLWKVVIRSESFLGTALESTDIVLQFDPQERKLAIEGVLYVNMSSETSARLMDGIQAYRTRTQPARDASWNAAEERFRARQTQGNELARELAPPSARILRREDVDWKAENESRKRFQDAQLYGGSLKGGSPKKKRTAGKRR